MTTEQAEEPVRAGDIPEEMEVEFVLTDESGQEIHRKMWIKPPKPEQILVWQRTVTNLTRLPENATWTGSEVMNALERLRKIVDTLLVNKADVNWLDDQFLEGALTFRTLVPMIHQTVEAFQQKAAESGNREQRRAAKKATRKKAS